jgi:protocatechuate 3,4-dioxygenase beta subunit
MTVTRSHPAIRHIVNPDGASRRTIIKAGIGLAGLTITGFSASRALAQDATPDAVATTCVLTPELTEGPYYLDGQLLRRDITEGKPGVPLRLQIAVQDTTDCSPLANAAVEIWHCDAQGAYSGVSGQNPGGGSADTAGETFLRGIQLTDDQGLVSFDTIFPGWYAGRTVHIHMKVEVDGQIVDVAEDPDATAVDGETYEGEMTVHTGQLFFDDALTDEILMTEAYQRDSSQGHITNDEDSIFGDHGDEPGFLVDIAGDVATGLTGTITVGVDPTQEAVQAGGPGGPAGGPPPRG